MHRASVTQGRASTGAELRIQGGNKGTSRCDRRLFRPARETRRAALFRRATRAFAERCGQGSGDRGALPRGGPPFAGAADLAACSGFRLALARRVPGLRFRPPVVTLGVMI